jgi:hypothetical protein
VSRLFALTLIVSSVVVVPACSSGDNIAPPTEQELTSGAKGLVMDFVASIKTSRKDEAANNAVALQESLAAITDPALDEVKATVKELVDLFASGASSTKVKAALDKLSAQANSL